MFSVLPGRIPEYPWRGPLGAPVSAEDCYSILRAAQNDDGGWGYHPGRRSAIEPSCWALLALGGSPEKEWPAIAAATAWLRRGQLPDGSWPSIPGQARGCWVTALACLALNSVGSGTSPEAARGLRWICKARPAESSLSWRIVHRLHARSRIVQQEPRLWGWGWTQGAASWVEPTALALLLLRSVPEELLSPDAKQRDRRGRAMLLDRSCAGGGWNSGNPMVYGVAGEPRVAPTVWALLALRDEDSRPENQKGLGWLETNCCNYDGLASSALALFCLRVFGRETPDLAEKFQSVYLNSRCLENVCAISWSAFALGPIPRWAE